MTTIAQWWMWLAFLSLVAIMIVVDLFFLGGRKSHRISTKEALSWTLIWFTLAMVFNLLLWGYLAYDNGLSIAHQKALEFFTGYFIEKSLALDNVFIFILIFGYFKIPVEYQRRVLLYGILGAIVMRFILIVSGLWLVNIFHWVLYFFGAFLVFTGFKMLVLSEQEPDLNANPVLRWMRRYFRITDTLHQEYFFIYKDKRLLLTPLCLVLVLIEVSDLIFSFDSIPAIFAITHDPFIVFTSNIFAILGLRALYFLLINLHNRFTLLKYGLACILVFVGCKLLLEPWYEIPILASLAFVVLTLLVSITLSIQKNRCKRS